MFLNYSNRNIERISDDIIEKLQDTAVISINLSNNKLNDINFGIFGEHIKHIDLSLNLIETIFIDGLHCDTLLLNNNCIKNIMINNSVIRKINLSLNSLTNVEIFDTIIEDMDLSMNTIENFMTYPTNIKKLDLSSNNLTKLIDMPDTIEYLNISFNILTQINYISNNIKHLDLSNNNLKHLDTEIIPVKHGSSIDVCNNPLKNIKFLQSITHINIIYLSSDNSKKNTVNYGFKKEELPKNYISKIIMSDSSDSSDSDNKDIEEDLVKNDAKNTEQDEKSEKDDSDDLDISLSSSFLKNKHVFDEPEDDINIFKPPRVNFEDFTKNFPQYNFTKHFTPIYEKYPLHWEIDL